MRCGSLLLVCHPIPQEKRNGQHGLNNNLILLPLALLPTLLLDLHVMLGLMRSGSSLLRREQLEDLHISAPHLRAHVGAQKGVGKLVHHAKAGAPGSLYRLCVSFEGTVEP